jgi:hypothetical protein
MSSLDPYRLTEAGSLLPASERATWDEFAGAVARLSSDPGRG